jgi:hypothetical protein
VVGSVLAPALVVGAVRPRARASIEVATQRGDARSAEPSPTSHCAAHPDRPQLGADHHR